MVNELVAKYSERLGKPNERVSFLHSDVAIEAAAELANIPQQYINISGYNFIWRLGQILGDARYFAAIRHEADGVYHFNPKIID